MAISGAICGIAGFVIVSGASHTISTATAGGRGIYRHYCCVAVQIQYVYYDSLVSFGMVFMNQGAVQIATQYGLNENASDVLLGIILFFLIGQNSSLIIKVKFVQRDRRWMR